MRYKVKVIEQLDKMKMQLNNIVWAIEKGSNTVDQITAQLRKVIEDLDNVHNVVELENNGRS